MPRSVTPTASDVELAEKIRDGDRDALTSLYEATFRDLWVFARRYVGPTRAEDVVQDVFLRMWTKRTWTIQTTVRAYLFGAVRHRALDVTHRTSIEVRAEETIRRDDAIEQDGIHPADTAVNAELRTMIHQTVAQFPERQRAAIILRIDRALSYSEIGDALGISATAAGNLVKKGEAKLREALRAYRPPASLDESEPS